MSIADDYCKDHYVSPAAKGVPVLVTALSGSSPGSRTNLLLAVRTHSPPGCLSSKLYVRNVPSAHTTRILVASLSKAQMHLLSIPLICAQLHSLAKYFGTRPGSIDFIIDASPDVRLVISDPPSLPPPPPTLPAASDDPDPTTEEPKTLLGVDGAAPDDVAPPSNARELSAEAAVVDASRSSENTCTVPLSDEHARYDEAELKDKQYISARSTPLRSSLNGSPLPQSHTRTSVPFSDAVAIRVPS